MPTMVALECFWCGNEFNLRVAEVNRRLKDGADRFFCSRSCSAKCGNEERGNKRKQITKTCPQCLESFETTTGAHEATFCSRGCASKGSVTEHRRRRAREMGKRNLRHDTATLAASLRSREYWKYKRLETFLLFEQEVFEFEHVVGDYIFDLALPNRMILVEFDGPDHANTWQAEQDKDRDEEAANAGWDIFRIPVTPNTQINPEVLYDLLSEPWDFD